MSAGRRRDAGRLVSVMILVIGCSLMPVGAQSDLVAAEPTSIDPARVMGAESCKKCHESEYTAWTNTTHFKNHERITSSAGQKYAEAYGGTEACMTCHSGRSVFRIGGSVVRIVSYAGRR